MSLDFSPGMSIANSFQKESNLYNNLQSHLSFYGAAQASLVQGVQIAPIMASLSTFPTQFNSLRMERSLAEGMLKNEQKDLQNIFNMIA
ncbi:MAG: hypothetical protein SFU25_05320 [Candidatus Caenarcaniphilales bacterium]|nr:hypothetical protein [Candidatus Caenarcaniphilales bacterium]